MQILFYMSLPGLSHIVELSPLVHRYSLTLLNIMSFLCISGERLNYVMANFFESHDGKVYQLQYFGKKSSSS